MSLCFLYCFVPPGVPLFMGPAWLRWLWRHHNFARSLWSYTNYQLSYVLRSSRPISKILYLYYDQYSWKRNWSHITTIAVLAFCPSSSTSTQLGRNTNWIQPACRAPVVKVVYTRAKHLTPSSIHGTSFKNADLTTSSAISNYQV